MIIYQLAYYKYNGHVCATYESAGTRAFEYGRTETCRSTSTASKSFVQIMTEPTTSILDKGKATRDAIAAHGAYMSKCSKGMGVDRHLLGLKKLVRDGETMPKIFTDEMYSKSQYWKLSTSQISSEYFDGYGWAEVVPDGITA